LKEQLRRIFEFDDHLPVTLGRIGRRVYPDDLPLLQDMLERARDAASYFEYQHRLLMPDQSVKHIHLFARATRDKYGRLEYVGSAQDVTDLYTITDAIANPVMVLTQDGTMLYANRVALNQWGLASGAPRMKRSSGKLAIPTISNRCSRSVVSDYCRQFLSSWNCAYSRMGNIAGSSFSTNP
jgi:hypothetical protein